jgi:hypothetical protein
LTEKFWEVNKYLIAQEERSRLVEDHNFLLIYEVAFSLFKNEKYADSLRIIPLKDNEFRKQFAELKECIKEAQDNKIL